MDDFYVITNRSDQSRQFLMQPKLNINKQRLTQSSDLESCFWNNNNNNNTTYVFKLIIFCGDIVIH